MKSNELIKRLSLLSFDETVYCKPKIRSQCFSFGFSFFIPLVSNADLF